MIDFIEYVVSELKSKRLSKSNALALIEQFSCHSGAAANAPVIHPLLHRNTSDLTQQSYTSSFTGQEFFLRDHRVHGQRMLPAVAYLEMVRAAMADALPDRDERTTLELRNVVWAQPVVVSGHKEIALALSVDQEQGRIRDPIDFEIYSVEEMQNRADSGSAHEIIHCQGQAVFTNEPAPPGHDIESLQAQMAKGRLEAASLYPAIAEAGINIGPSHQGVKTIYQGEQQQLVHIFLPEAMHGTHDEYVLHPSIMDSVLQAATGLVIDLSQHANQPPVPFALESLRIFSSCRKQMFAWARYTPGSQREDAVAKLDIDLCDQEGNVCVRMLGLSSRVLSADIGAAGAQGRRIGRLLAAPEWQSSVAAPAHSGETAAEHTQRHVILCDIPNLDARRLEAALQGSPHHGSCLELKATQQTIAGRYSEVALACFEKIQTILKSGLQGRTLVQVAITDSQMTFAGLSGLLKSAARENPQLLGQVIITKPEIAADELAIQLQQAQNRPHESIVKYERGEQYFLRWRAIDECQASRHKPKLAFKDQGVYLITGGLGGLGVLFAREILRQTLNARVILTGRSAPTAAKQALLDELSAGTERRVLYRQLDLSDLDQVRQLLTASIEELGQINGIIHSAGMISDAFILKKTPEEFSRVLEPKVTGTFNLDQASKDINLDFLVLFSAGAAVYGNTGQADYAAANGFMDQFAGYRNQLVAAKGRQGLTVSINWPLWQEGGMSIDPANQRILQRATGMYPMQTETGIAAFYQCLESQRNQVLVVEGDLEQVHRALLAEREIHAAVPENDASHMPMEMDSRSLEEKTQGYLRKQFSAVLKLPSHRIDPLAPLEKYGIDSILAMNLTNQLELTFGSLPKTLFFEYRTIRELTAYFIKSYAGKLASLFAAANTSGGEKVPAGALLKTLPEVPTKATSGGRLRRRRDTAVAGAGPAISTDPIAIIGLSGRYPEAVNIEAYWRNLRDGKDCIIEVPKHRWDWREYFTEDRSKAGHHYSKWGGFIEGVDEFDPLFFNISPREARIMDPQERLFLQHAWMAVEDAGYTRASLQVPHKQGLAGQVGQVGVYVGVMYGEYNLSGSLAGIANRVSSVLNLHGPSMALDTMCSSSLTAIHLACQDLKQGRTDLAIAGGVNVSIHPSKYLMLSAGQFISSDGHCQSFGEGGDGYIPGEGVGAVVLRRLADAERAGDHIYAIVKGSALNHGGRTNGYTVPNPQAQASVISQALAESNTNARHVTYIEAHGTGTKLGDPIEIAALSKAFYQEIQEASPQNKERGFCAIGSAKSNIGHCESAAGIAGLTKVLLQMQHQQIVPSLHSARLNPHIDFDNSPFVVNQSLRAWDRPVIDARQLPRTAGLSSFGAGGSNAHVIVEEYLPSAEFERAAIHTQVIVPLSARTAEQLRQRARDLLDFIRTPGQLDQAAGRSTPLLGTVDLPAMAYTLQVGREAMEERLGFVVGSAEQLAEKLRAYIDGEQDIEGAFQGQVKNHKDTLSLFNEDTDFQDTIDKWIARKSLSKLLDLWVKGLELNWHKLYGEGKPRRISLPTYPFAKEKYWIETVGQVVASAAPRPAVTMTAPHPALTTAALHPLLHANTSDLSEQKYSSIFSGEESFFSDHQVRGRKILPAVAYLEMARAAVTQAARAQPEASILELNNIVWGQPLVAAANKEVTIALIANGNEQIDYEIHSQGKDQEIVHCQGQAVFSRLPAPARLDVAQLRARMQRGGLDAALVYSVFAKTGLHYGPAHRGITSLHKGENQLLAQLSLPAAVGTPQGDYLLHPSLMDCAFQASIALIADPTQAVGRPSLPVSLDSLRIVFACVKEMLVWVRYSQDSKAGDERVKLDIDLCDPQGNVCVQMRGLSLQQAAIQQATIGTEDQTSVRPTTPNDDYISPASVVAKPQSVQLTSLQVDAVASITLAVTKRESVQLIGLQDIASGTASTTSEQNIPSSTVSLQPSNDTMPYADASEDSPPANEPEPVFSREQLQQQLAVSLAEALYMEVSAVDSAKPFVELGLDSIVGVEWVQAINKQYGLAIAATRVYDYPNIKELASFVEKEIATLPAFPKPPALKQTASKRLSAAPAQASASAPEHKSSWPLSTSYPVLKSRVRTSRTTERTYVSSQTNSARGAEKIAIVGMSGRYPQANNLQQYWHNLAQGKNSVVEIPPSRWDVNEHYDQDPAKKGKIYCKWLGMLDDVDCFDPLFFQISPAEAENMDPQHRLFMQEAYRAFEDAGYSNKALSNKKCGVYLGIMSNEYSLLLSRNSSLNVDATGTSYAIGAARIAYYLNLKGPAIPIDTACSSSLVAIHLACQGLLNREIDMALAGGVTLYLTADSYLAMCRAGMLSPDGQCKTFDNSADGFVPGEGVGALVLKRLQDAEADNDFIHGVILGSAINQDGRTNGITAPSVSSQIELERELYARYKIDPETISYVETHGTGTKLGDPIELEALATVFGEKTSKRNYCALGSAKTNIGHTSAAAGVASVQKVLLSMRHQTLAPSLNVTTENALFDFKSSPFYICREKQGWNVAPGSLRRASVSSFGFSGTNAHLVMEEYSSQKSKQAVSPVTKVAVLLSARTPAQLQQKARDLLDFVLQEKQSKQIDLAAMAYTLQVGREAFKERLGLVVSSVDQLAEKLRAHIADADSAEDVYQGQAGRDKDALAVFSADADLRETVNKWLADRKLSSLLDLWVKGLELDWSKLYPGENKPRRISLPTYPFAKERYWTATPALPSAVGRSGVTDGGKTAKPEDTEARQRLSYYPRWKVSALERSEEDSLPAGPILILDTSDALFLAMKEQLEGASKQPPVVLVTAGESFREIAPDIFTLNVEREEHFHQLIERLKSRDRLPRQILHHCGAAGNFDGTDTREGTANLSAQLNHGVYALFHLCKTLMAHKHHARLRILSVFCSDLEATAPQNAALAGFFKTLTLENPHYLAKVVDIRDAASAPVSILEKTRLLIDEFQDKNWHTAEVRYQQQLRDDTHRYVRHVRELARYNPDTGTVTELPLKQQGVYIVTGGLGVLGFIFCEYLVKNFNARLVLLGRSALTPAQEAKLLRLKSHQPETIYLQADVAKLQDVQRAVQQAKARFAQINGVIHAAGVNRDSFILKKTREEMESVLAPKVFGVVNLDRATSGENLDLFVMFSSVAATMGNPGQCDYAYGNHFLDSFAASREGLRSRQKRSGRTLSINWPFWMEGGMTLSQGDVARTEAQAGLSPLPTKEGIRYWEEFLRSDFSQAVALYGNASKIQAYLAEGSPRDDTNRPAPTRIMDPAGLLAETEAYLRRLIGEEIKLSAERVDCQERFESFGIDSIVVGRLNAGLARDLGALPKTLFYEYETIEELAKYLAQEAQHALMGFFSLESSADLAPIQAGSSRAKDTEAKSIRQKVQAREKQDDPEQIAIIGAHGCYPHSKDLDEYWENLRQGRDLIGVIPANRWDFEEFYDSDPDKAADGKIYCKWGAFLEDFDKFDSPFFNIPAEEARIIDPQERLFLESVWAALEDAGYTRDSLKRYFPKAKSADVGVFVGVTTNSYHLLAAAEWSRGNMRSPSALPWSIANRVSYFFDFQGPSMPVDTACSSSLVAIHLACESLKKQECQVAVAGGVNLYLHPAKYVSFCQRRMLSLGGKCHSFGAGDDGFVPGEGVGTLILKPLSKAIEHGDHVYAVISASAFDHSGRSNGYSAPNPNSQARLISHTLSKARVHPESIGYIEGHGTGTQLGDSLEIAALTQAFRRQTAKRQFCPVGSVKANLGHSESAAGIAGVTKILLQMKHRQLVPTIHSDEVNPNIEFEGSPFYLQHGLTSWQPSPPHPRRALINSFGAGGVNACAVLEEHQTPGISTRSRAPGPYLVILSAKDEDRLLECLNRLLGHVRKQGEIDLAGLSYTLQVGREAMPERLAIVVTQVQELIERLGDWSRQRSGAAVYRGSLDPRRGVKKSPQKNQDILKAMFETGNLSELAQAWTAGEEVDWEKLYSRNRPARISLPTYPFAKDRYWISDCPAPKRIRPVQSDARLHPLISYNSSTLQEVSFCSLLSNNEFYARDHKVNEQMIFPGSGFLEIACVCASLAGAKKVRSIQDVVWIQPLVFRDESQMIQISLKPAQSRAEYVIASYDEDREKVVHSEGVIHFQDDAAAYAAGEESLPIEALKEQCPRPLDGAHYYGLFEKSGVSYGPAFRTMQKLYVSSSFALSELRIAAHLRADFDQFILHPCIIDGALQTVSGLIGGNELSVPYLPFAIDEVQIIRSTSQSCYVYVEQAGSEQQGNAEVKKFNIKVSNEKGLVLVTFKNFCVRAFKFTPASMQLSSS